jgi:predicted O-methyltransferase YrrM
MGFILPEYYEKLSKLSNRNLPKILIETGTFKGRLALIFLERFGSIEPFSKIYTFELGENIAKIASKRFKLFEEYIGDTSKFNFHTDEMDEEFKSRSTYLYEQIELINSDSVKGLQELLPTINEPCCFWLDAHAGS